MNKIKLLVIVGPTASGKSNLSLEVAERFDAEIVSVDSMLVYKGMDIGTAKPTAAELLSVPHHMIDIVEPDAEFSAADYMKRATIAIEDITARGKRALVAGGTGLYLRALLEGIFEGPSRSNELRREFAEAIERDGLAALHVELAAVDPEAAARIHPNDATRIVRALEVYRITGRSISSLQKEQALTESPYETLKIGLTKERAELYTGIDRRVDAMMDAGLLEEVRGLLRKGYSSQLRPMQALGYKEMVSHIEGVVGLSEAIEALKKNTRNFAKRQFTWFGKDKRIRWFAPGEKTAIMAAAAEFWPSKTG
ncbi:tRNA dimethylallyltransferase [hydrothermal vent metagenome]|uniref:tRNA dimethylallyltransferase n=1 Tax=hydrothermal vent metagenome TaxID=652676 RepID=A0A3B0RPE5_9ZZZZ